MHSWKYVFALLFVACAFFVGDVSSTSSCQACDKMCPACSNRGFNFEAIVSIIAKVCVGLSPAKYSECAALVTAKITAILNLCPSVIFDGIGQLVLILVALIRALVSVNINVALSALADITVLVKLALFLGVKICLLVNIGLPLSVLLKIIADIGLSLAL